VKTRILFAAGILFCGMGNAATPWLHVDGNKIKDPAGNIVILRGVSTETIDAANGSNKTLKQVLDIVTNTNDPASQSPGWYPRIVRLPVGPGSYNANPDAYIKNQLKPAVDYATSKGLYAIIDLHYVHDTYPNDADVKAFWTKVAPLFKDYSNVLFEAYNEPINKGSWGAFKPIMQAYVDIIRKGAPRNLVVAGSPSWDQVMGDAATNPITGGNIIYSLHMYGEHWKRAGNVAQAAACAKVHPMITTEWGFRPFPGVDNTVTNYGKPFTDWMEKLGISWTTWCASDDWGPTMFDADAKGNWTLQVGEGYAGGFTKDLLYAKRNANQPTAGVVPGHVSRAFARLLINGNEVSVDLAANNSSLQILSLQGRIIKSLRVDENRETVVNDRIHPGVYLASSGSGPQRVESMIFVR
jgi:hypothetical protein